jgi:hypothetical protein
MCRPLFFPYGSLSTPALIAYGDGGHKRRQRWRRVAMADVIYLTAGILFFAVMGVYAHACNRL